MLYRNQNDETLVMLTLAGEQSAYEVLVVRYQNAVIASAASVTKNAFMAEDAAQDAFVTAWMKLDTLKDPKKFASWVCRIAKNCALNMIVRYRSFIPIETVENQNVADSQNEDLAELYALTEEKDELHQSIGRLPEKIKQIIYLHYFEGLSVAEIADRMRTSVGTVKWQLHDGRKRIRKELCAMNEKYNDTLVEKVMKKVEELKLWQVKNDKSGFEIIYRDVLREVEELPECKGKQHALADVLMRGWWWLPGKKNDELFERIREAAELGKNDEVMEFIVTREDSQVSGKEARAEFRRDKQIPRLEKAGFVKALAREWFWLGHYYLLEDKKELAEEAFENVRKILSPSEILYQYVPTVKKWKKSFDLYKDKNEKHYETVAQAIEYKYIDGELRFWKEESVGRGYINSIDRRIKRTFQNASLCDGKFFADIPLGDSFTATDGSTLTFASDNETVMTPCGKFEKCQLWIVRQKTEYGLSAYRTYYKEGVGIVRQEHKLDGFTDSRVLKAYDIKDGDGLLPIASGNVWEYADEYDSEFLESSLRVEVAFADESSAVITVLEACERKEYNENSWLDMIQKIRNEYYFDDGKNEKICDVYGAIERAETLAKTPLEKAHTKAAASVARRILDTNPIFNPDCKATGHWNFFNRAVVQKNNGTASISHDSRWSFEWKETGGFEGAYEPLLYNHMFGILQDATNCIWSDEWRVGASPTVEYVLWGDKQIKTQVVCTDAGTVTTKAGSFENCIKLELDISGLESGLAYRGGKKEYYFADGIGIVRMVIPHSRRGRGAVYELSEYEGTGEGYMPLCGGLMRRYDALDLTDGFVASSLYTFLENDEGETVIFADKTGIRVTPPPITEYGAIEGERIQEKLWNEGKTKESHMRHGVNDFRILLHYLARPSYHRNDPDRSIGICKFNMQMMESFGDGELPDAWLSHYAWTAMVCAAASFGKGDKEQGYLMLDKTYCSFEKWSNIENGELLSVGNREVFGDIKLIKGEAMILLPDGSREIVAYGYTLDASGGRMYSILSQKWGWEWFNSVRNEDRFKEYIERSRKLAEK